MTLEEFEKLKNERIIIKDNDGNIVRECKVYITDNYFDWDRNKSFSAKCRWNGKDVIYEWYEHLSTLFILVVCNNKIEIVVKSHNWYSIIIEDKNCYIKGRGNIDNCNTEEIESMISKMFRHLDKLNINKDIKGIIKNLILESKYIYSKQYNGYKKEYLEVIE